MINRRNTRVIDVGGVKIGNPNPISIQSMTNTITCDVENTVAQIKRLEDAGCDIIRFAVNDFDDAEAIPKIKEKINIPTISDIQYDYKLALEAAKYGVDGLRINPGNIGERWKVKEVVEAAKDKGISIRVGVNSGSISQEILDKFSGVNVDSLVESALSEVNYLESLGFKDIKVSLKASDPLLNIRAYEKFASLTDYPLHLGVTEAGPPKIGAIKSAIGIGSLLQEGIGDTIRVSLTSDPVEEIYVAKEILKSLGLKRDGIEIISCPTCSRTKIDLISLVDEVEKKLNSKDLNIKIALMGCRVNGPGEAREADIGIAGGDGRGVIFKHGEIVKSVDEKDLVDELIKEIENLRWAMFDFDKFSSILGIENEEVNLNIVDINFDEESLKLNVVMSANHPVEDGFINTIEEKILDYIPEIYLDFKIIYEEIDPIDLAKETILLNSPSCNCWLSEDLFRIDEDKGYLILNVPDKTCYNLMNSNKMKSSLDSVLDNHNLNFVIEKDFDEDEADDYMGTLKDLEKEVLETTVVKQEVKNKPQPLEFGKKRYINRKFKGDEISIAEVSTDFQYVILTGTIFKIEVKELRTGNRIILVKITDYTSSIVLKKFMTEEEVSEFMDEYRVGTKIRVSGKVEYDNFMSMVVISFNAIEKIEEEKVVENSERHRVELRLHTKMSTMSGITEYEEFAKYAKDLGLTALAITDITDVQGFTNAMDASKSLGIKAIYGLDMRMVDDKMGIVENFEGKDYNGKFVVFDIETTGLSPANDMITEIGAVKIENGVIVDRFSRFVNPMRNIPEKVVELTRITNEMVANEPPIEVVIKDFVEFIGNATLVAHNAEFDTAFIRRDLAKVGIRFDYPVLDTLYLARATLNELKRFNLSAISKKLGVTLEGAHRAVNDAEATAEAFIKMMKIGGSPKSFEEINNLFEKIDKSVLFSKDATAIVKTQAGLKNLYKLVSLSHMMYYNVEAKLPKSVFDKYREGLLLGSGTSKGELWNAIYFGKPHEKLLEIASYYDYLEIQPIGNNLNYVVAEKVDGKEALIDINKKILELGDELNIPVVATGDVYYLYPHQDLPRRIVLSGVNGPLNPEVKIPNTLYFKNTDQMLEEFSYLEDRCEEVVIDNSNKIADMVEDIKPLPDGTFPPYIEGSEEMLRKITYEKAHSIYGEELPEIVEKRLERELSSIIGNGYAVLYIIAEKLVKKSNDDGYLVGSRGSVGSSFAATMAGITEVNPLPPHYVCPKCKYSEFVDEKLVGSGVDLERKNCPHCGTELNRDGHNIPFEVFLGFEGDKEPDIDLNFAGEYQPVAHKYTEELFGEGYVFRAGTIGTVAENTAYRIVKNYYKDEIIPPVEIDRLAKEITGVKRTSGQHPGGVMIVPKTSSIYDFSPIQYPADKKSSGVITTHFDYNFLHGKILKLDILGHDGPTIIKMLEDLTGLKSEDIYLDDKRTMSLFSSSEELKMNPEIYECETGTLGIPEFGTDFVKRMLIKTKPSTFSELVQISGLSHGTDVWTNNAEDLVDQGLAKLQDVISTREDIMVYLIQAGAENKMAFFTMEKVRKGKGLTDEQRAIMEKLPLPSWYIGACEKIKYMFPKAHAVAYVMLSFRVAYYKLNYPKEYYATYFTNKLTDFDLETISKGVSAMKEKLNELLQIKNPSQKEKGQRNTLEMALEMYSRGIEFKFIDIYKSQAKKFIIDEGGIRIPFMAVPGLGEAIANSIVENSKENKYISVEDFINKTGATKSIVEMLRDNNCFEGMQENNQLSLFNF